MFTTFHSNKRKLGINSTKSQGVPSALYYNIIIIK